MRTENSNSITQRWRQKFACAIRGVVVGARGQTSFQVHLPMAIAVVGLAAWLHLSLAEFSILVVCIAVVISAELFNSALEHLAKAITDDQRSELRDALDIASGAVLAASLGAAIVGMMLLLPPLYRWWFVA